MKRNVINHCSINSGEYTLQGKYHIELSNTLICQLRFDLSTTLKTKQVEDLLDTHSHSVKPKNEIVIFFLISDESTAEVDEIDKCIEDKCIKYRLYNPILISLVQVETKYAVKNEGLLQYRLKKEKIKHSLNDDLQFFLEKLFAGQITTDLNEEHTVFSIDKPKQKLKNLIPLEIPLKIFDGPKQKLKNFIPFEIPKKAKEPFEMKIGYKQQKSILYREDCASYDNFESWFPPVDRQQVYEDESTKFTLYHVLIRSRGIKRNLKRKHRYDSNSCKLSQ